MSSHKPARIVSERFSTEAKSYRNYIGGCFAEPSVSQIDVLNPATGAIVGRVPESTGQEVDAAVRAAKAAQPSWEQLPAIERADHLRAISAKLRQHRTELADIIVREQGKIRGLAQVEVDFTADYIDRKSVV